jgi:hypothetical protein
MKHEKQCGIDVVVEFLNSLTPKVLWLFGAQNCLKLPPLRNGRICQDLSMLQ